MTSERIKEIQQQTAYPDSVSVQQALLQVWNECSQLPQQEKLFTKHFKNLNKMEQPTPIEWLQQVYKVTGALKESDFNYANNWTKKNTYTEEQVREALFCALNIDKTTCCTTRTTDSIVREVIQSLKQ
jgi:hypothetical protein